MLNDYQQEIQRVGFCKIEKVFSNAELERCEKLLDAMMDKDGILLNYFKGDMSSENNARQQRELVRPAMLSFRLRRSAIFKRCFQIANAYFGKAYYLYDHAIFKMPNSTTVTPWHQDQAYLGNAVIIPSLHFWIPFQDTYVNNGAMQFVAGSHHGLVPHMLAYPENPHVLKVIEEPHEHVCTMDIRRGDISLHTNLTLHSATTNNSESIRKAWIIHFGQQSEWYKRRLKLKQFISKIQN